MHTCLVLIVVDLSSEIPLYRQVRDQVVDAVAGGGLAAGSRLPSTRQLAADLGINVHTVNRAYEELRREGFITLGRRRGAVVLESAAAPELDPSWDERYRALVAEAAARGVEPADILKRSRELIEVFAGTRIPAFERNPNS